jgi:dipeptidyl aminopeptidase/acylaminoacyl peptidase
MTMADIRKRFRVLDRVEVPDVWSDVRDREPGEPQPDRPPLVRRLGTIAVALAVGAGGTLLGVRALQPAARVPAVGAASGLIAFTASVPAEEAPPGSGVVVGSSGEDDAGPPQVYTVEPDGSGLRALTADPALKGSLAWSPEGDLLAFTAYDLRREREELFVMAPDGSDRRLVCAGCTGSFFVLPDDAVCIEGCPLPGASPHALEWSPDGRWIAAPHTQARDLALIDPASGRVELVPLAGTVTGTSWSPDGARLAVTVDSRRGGGLFVVDVGDRTARPLLSAEPYSSSPPAWSPDGDVIAFPRSKRVDGDLYAQLDIIPVDGSRITTVLGADDLFEIYDLEWSPDGERLGVLHHPVEPPTAGLLTVDREGLRIRTLALCESGEDVDGLCSTNGGNIAWSADGEILAFENYDGDQAALSLLTLDREVVSLSGDLELGCCIAWQIVPEAAAIDRG